MKKFFASVIFLGCFSAVSFAQLKLEVEVTDLKNDKGKVMMQLFDQNEKVIDQKSSAIIGSKCIIKFPSLEPGQYAVRYYHDENENGNMETNLVGKPTEGYGFSNNVTGKFGPPPFEKWLFEVNSDKKIIIKTVY